MDSNSLILGSIPGNSGSIHKTYEESIIMGLSHLSYRDLFSTFNYDFNDPFKLYLNKNEGAFMTLRKSSIGEDLDDYIEYEILNVFIIEQERAIVEVIDKRILHKHLVDERMLLERIANKNKEMSL